MTISAERSDAHLGVEQLPGRAVQLRWWRRSWMYPLAFLSIVFILYSLPRYLSFDPARSQIPIRPDYALHYQLLVAHIFFSAVAMATAPFQAWRWLRQRHPKVHRVLGRIYLFGAIPGAAFSLAVMPVSFAPVPNAVAGAGWLVAAILGWRMARQHRYSEHRRWMIYSAALLYSIIWARLGFLVVPQLPGYNLSWNPYIVESGVWFGIVVNLLLAQWWIVRTARKSGHAFNGNNATSRVRNTG